MVGIDGDLIGTDVNHHAIAALNVFKDTTHTVGHLYWYRWCCGSEGSNDPHHGGGGLGRNETKGNGAIG